VILGQTPADMPQRADYFAHYNEVLITGHTHSTVVTLYMNDLRSGLQRNIQQYLHLQCLHNHQLVIVINITRM
jgi:hypothetical protein